MQKQGDRRDRQPSASSAERRETVSPKTAQKQPGNTKRLTEQQVTEVLAKDVLELLQAGPEASRNLKVLPDARKITDGLLLAAKIADRAGQMPTGEY